MVSLVRFLPPHVNLEVVARPLVQQQLGAAGDVPLTLLVAPPGFGKATEGDGEAGVMTWLKSLGKK